MSWELIEIHSRLIEILELLEQILNEIKKRKEETK